MIVLPERSFKGTGIGEQLIVVGVEVGEVCINLQDPIRLDQNDGADVNETTLPLEEWFIFHPGDDIVQGPGDNQGRSGRR